ncbi:MAG: PQQ-like beta-propeller repeat protein [Pirellulales bacterium]|nr:PQQ-like beta-propeller repeat protein [Pirellulales bacterium]
MRLARIVGLLPVSGLFALAALTGQLHSAEEENWPQWRGPLGTGAAPHANPPLVWDEHEGKNIRWKTAIPGRGHSTPIIWDDFVFLTTAIAVGDALPPRPSTAPGNHDNLPVTHRHKFVALAVSRSTGNILWQTELREALPDEQGHYTASLASHAPATDGKHLFVFFGSYGLYCLDLAGELIWEEDFGLMDTRHGHGEGSSPVLYNNLLVICWDHEGQSFIVALDKRTGQERWRVLRDEVTSWATPIVVEHAGEAQVVVSGTDRVRGYELASGEGIWECGGLSANVVASPVAGGGMVFAGSSYDTKALLAIRLDGAAGDITGTDRIAWTRRRGTPYVPSPLLHDGGLYFLRHYQSVLTRVDATTGEDRPGPFRLQGISNVYASPVAAAGRVYITDLDGTTVVVSSGEVLRTLALNRISESVSASAAIAGRDLVLRGDKHLYCLTETNE